MWVSSPPEIEVPPPAHQGLHAPSYRTSVPDRMITFVPRLPTAAAWKHKAFPDQPNLQARVAAMRRRPRYFNNGQILFRDTIHPYVPRFHVLSGVAELEQVLTKLEWDPSTIHKIVLFEDGYFLVGTKAAASR